MKNSKVATNVQFGKKTSNLPYLCVFKDNVVTVALDTVYKESLAKEVIERNMLVLP